MGPTKRITIFWTTVLEDKIVPPVGRIQITHPRSDENTRSQGYCQIKRLGSVTIKPHEVRRPLQPWGWVRDDYGRRPYFPWRVPVNDNDPLELPLPQWMTPDPEEFGTPPPVLLCTEATPTSTNDEGCLLWWTTPVNPRLRHIGPETTTTTTDVSSGVPDFTRPEVASTVLFGGQYRGQHLVTHPPGPRNDEGVVDPGITPV